jgi:hypothetical protein
VVGIKLMRNDVWLIGRDHKPQPEPDDAQRVLACKSFVMRSRRLYPKAHIVCALGSMEATRPGSAWPGYVSTAVGQIRRQHGDKRIDTLFFEFTGDGQHPRVRQHGANAARLTASIKQKVAW